MRDRTPSPVGLAILTALQWRQQYAGTVPAHVKATRRRRNKAARISRRVNRGRA